MTDQQQQQQAAQMPALAVEEVLHWGASPDGADVVIIVQSASQGPVRLAMTSKVVADLLTTAQSARLQAAKNAQAAGGEDAVAAIPVNSYKVAALAGGKMTLLMIDPNAPTEMVYMLPDPQVAIDIGRALVAEGMKASKINAAINAGTKLVTPGPKRILRPH